MNPQSAVFNMVTQNQSVKMSCFYSWRQRCHDLNAFIPLLHACSIFVLSCCFACLGSVRAFYWCRGLLLCTVPHNSLYLNNKCTIFDKVMEINISFYFLYISNRTEATAFSSLFSQVYYLSCYEARFNLITHLADY